MSCVWALLCKEQTPHEVICHNDFAPYNCVFRSGEFVGAIDFDTCAPGPRLWDIAYTAYRFVPLMPPAAAETGDAVNEHSPFALSQICKRLDVFLSAYAGSDLRLSYSYGAVLDTAVRRLQILAAWTDSHSEETGILAFASHATMYRFHAQWIDGPLRNYLACI